MTRNLNSKVVTALVLTALGAGCQKKETPPPPQPNKAAQPNKPAAQAPVQKAVSSAAQAPPRLDFSKRVDPFKPYAPAPPPTPVAAAPQGGGAPAGDVLPIQSFELSKFKVVGIIAGLNENKALVVDPNGKGYVVQVGMLIGNANGRISRITATGVEVVESYKEGSGRVKQRKTVLTLAKKR
jgi:type IV pilus assembly protein PilP